MRNTRWLISLIALSAITSACEGSQPPVPGTITGVAQPCVGEATAVQYAHLTLRVTLSHHGRVVARQVVRGSHVYRFRIEPGAYVVRSLEGDASHPVHVIVSSRQTAHVTIRSYCM
jgi:hypothetical protein